MIPISLASFIGTIIFGPFFDSVGRRKMITFTCKPLYLDVGSGLLLLFNAFMFLNDVLSLFHIMLIWVIIFIVATSGASAAHLTISEIFPLVI